jgi:CBS domain-containing protein
MLVKDIMTKGARTVTEETPIKEVASLMCLYRFSGLPVVEGEDRLVGFIAEKDVLAQLFPSVEDAMEGMTTIDLKEKVKEYGDLLNRRVADLMTRGVRTVSPDMPILKAAIIMANHRFRRIPVAEGGRLVGMLSLGDIHKAIFHKSLTEG